MRGAILHILALLALGACNSGTDENQRTTASRAVMRPAVPVPPGTVPRGASGADAALSAPGPAVTPALLDRGRQQFLAFCSPCHGVSGRGDGIVVSRGFPRPPSYHEERLRQVGAEHIVSVITNGRGVMYPYGERIPPAERWAIAHYVKALQAGMGSPGEGTVVP
jgi:mono/diheme cytochrome c family protein